jgi:polyisoprenoid-binding protein YceI
MIRTCALALIAASLLCGPATAAGTETTWKIDPAHSAAQFSVRHLVLSNVHGTIPVTSGEIHTNGSTLPTSFSATLDSAALDTKNESRDNDLHGPRWLDVAKYPTIVFRSTKITGTPEAFTAVGDLTVHGVTKPVTLAVKTLGTLADSRGNQHIGYEATTSLDRTDFGVSLMSQSGGALIAGTTVSITIDVEAISRPS